MKIMKLSFKNNTKYQNPCFSFSFFDCFDSPACTTIAFHLVVFDFVLTPCKSKKQKNSMNTQRFCKLVNQKTKHSMKNKCFMCFICFWLQFQLLSHEYLVLLKTFYTCQWCFVKISLFSLLELLVFLKIFCSF